MKHLTPLQYNVVPQLENEIQLSEFNRSSSRKSRRARKSELPQNPQRIPSTKARSILRYAGDTLTLLVSMAFLIYAFILLRYNNVPTKGSNLKSMLSQAARAGPTIFPLLFVAAVGRTLRSFALWRLERGEKLGLLDQLLGCTSLVGTVTTQFEVGGNLLLAVGLVLVWAFSPLGGQSSIRALGFEQHYNVTPTTIQYLSMNNSGENIVGADTGTTLPPTIALLLSSMASSPDVKNSSRDLWSNFKVPFISQFDPTTRDDQGWVSVSDRNDTLYTSLIGVPIANLTSGGNSSFNFETSYINLDCPSLYSAENFTAPTGWANASTGYIDVYYPPINQRMDANFWTNLPPQQLVWRMINVSLRGPNDAANCTMTNVYVEVDIDCVNVLCHVTRMRNSTQENLPPGWTPLDNGSWRWFLPDLIGSFSSHAGYPTPLSFYIEDPDYPFSFNASLFAPLFLAVTPETFSTRLTQIFNSYWLSVIGNTIIPLGGRVSEFNEQYGLITTAAGGTLIQGFEVFVYYQPWFALLIVSSLLTLLCGLAGIALTMERYAPDLAMNISSMARDNMYMQLPPGGSFLHDSERSALLRNVRVYFGDVAPRSRVGHIGLAVQTDPNNAETRIRHDRIYE